MTSRQTDPTTGTADAPARVTHRAAGAGAPRVRRIVAHVAVLHALAAAGCGASEQAAAERPVVVVSVPPQAYFVERLAGDLVTIEIMLPPGASPHSHEPTIRQVRAMHAAAIYVKVGHPNFPFERVWLERLLAESTVVTVVDCSNGLPVQAGDPHVWVSPSAVRTMVPRIAAALAAHLPNDRALIEKRLARFLEEIAGLDSEIRTALSDVRGRRFYVFHPAWGYFAREYGLDQVPIESGHMEPDPAELAQLIARARAEHVRAIFVQPQFSRSSAEVVADDIGARVVTVDPLARNWLQNMRQVGHMFAEVLGP